MAKKKTPKKAINKSAEIREYLARNPTAGPKRVQSALAEKGIEVSSGLVGRVKYSASKKKAPANQKRPKKAHTKSPGKPLMGRAAATKKKSNRSKAADTRTRDELRQAGDLMRQAMDLVIKVGAKEAKQLVNRAEGMVRTIRSRK